MDLQETGCSLLSPEIGKESVVAITVTKKKLKKNACDSTIFLEHLGANIHVPYKVVNTLTS
jgi:hypothetical protein